MITREHPELSLSRQCEVLSISRSSFYYAPMGESPATLALMRRIDELFLKYPVLGLDPSIGELTVVNDFLATCRRTVAADAAA